MHKLILLFLCAAACAQQVQLGGTVTLSGTTSTNAAPQVVQPQPLNVTPAQYPSGIANSAYGVNGQGVDVSAANGTAPYTCSISVGSLPTGLNLSTSGANTNCHIGGTPTVAATFNFTITVTDSKSATGSIAASIVINSSLQIIQTTIPAAIVGTADSITFTATGGTGGGYVFTIPAGTLPPGMSFATPTLSGTPTQAGNFPLTVKVTDSGANTASWSFTLTVSTPVSSGGANNRWCTPQGTWIGATTDGPAALPKRCMYTPLSATPSPGVTRGPDSTTATVQADLNISSCGDTVLVTAGSSLGAITLPVKGCDPQHWVTLKSTGVSNVNFPAEGTRMSPCWSGVASLPNRPAYPCTSPQVLTFKMVAPASGNALRAQSSVFYRIIGAEITRVSTPGVPIFNLVDLSAPTSQTNHIIFDRIWFHGINQDGNFPMASQAVDTSTTRAIYLGQSSYIAVIDSYFSDFYDTGSRSANGNTDAQCIGGGFGGIANSGWGVYKFVNNHCEASGEGILLGGAGGPQLTPAGCTIMVNCNQDVPTDIEVRQNLFFKPLSWNGNTTSPQSVGWPVVKNGLEMKIGAQALFEGNVIWNVWYQAQVGYCWSIAPKNQSGGTAPNAVGTAPTAATNDFTYRYNYCYNAAYGIGLYASKDAGCGGTPTCDSQGANRVSIHDNVIGDNLNLGSLSGTSAGDLGEFFVAVDQSGTGVLDQINNVNISHNTFVKGVRALMIFGGGANEMHNWTVQNNVWAYSNFGFFSFGSVCDQGAGITNKAFNVLNACVTNYTWDHNAVFNWPGSSTLGANWPTNGSGAGNFFTNGLGSPAWFSNYGTGDSAQTPSNYAANASGALHGTASDGSDIGANITQLNSEISGVATY